MFSLRTFAIRILLVKCRLVEKHIYVSNHVENTYDFTKMLSKILEMDFQIRHISRKKPDIYHNNT